MEIQGIQRITQHEAFEKELKQLGKKYRTLPEDLHTFINVSVRAVHLLGQKPEDLGHFPIQGLSILCASIFNQQLQQFPRLINKDQVGLRETQRA